MNFNFKYPFPALLGMLLVVSFFISCEEEVETEPNYVDPNLNDVEIAVENKSAFTIDSVFINTSGGENLYGTVGRNKTSEYKSYRFSYSYFYTRFKVGNKEFINQPIDYVGEERIDNGKYVFEISDIDTTQQIFKYLLESEN